MEENHIRMYKTRETPENEEDSVRAKMEELIEIKEEINKAKESATQSWLDSKPLIDELEKQQSELATAKNRTSMSNVIIAELKSQLQAMNSDMKSKMVEELEATKIANEMSDELDQIRRELETIKLETEEERKNRADLKQVLRTRRQALRAMQLTVRAIRVDSEAYGASLADAKKVMGMSERENSTVELSEEEYFVLKERAKDEGALAEWRVAVAVEQKVAAEASRNVALSRLEDLNIDQNKPRCSEMSEEDAEEEEQQQMTKNEYGVVGPRARVEENGRTGRRRPQQTRRNRNVRPVEKKKCSSIFAEIKSFIVRSLRKLFG